MKKTTKKLKSRKSNAGHNGLEAIRLNVLKTYKIYIGGKFPRTESGRYYLLKDARGKPLANICLSSKKDFREAVVAARSAFNRWASSSGMNRGQILYRLAEMLEDRKAQFIRELVLLGAKKKQADNEVCASIDRLVYYAGWCDKYQQVFSAVNPVASSHFNFSMPEPTGVVGIIAPGNSSLIGLISLIAPVIAGGNTCIFLASQNNPLCAVTFAEVIHSSDVPAGVVNILTGKKKELYKHFSSHMDVNALVYGTENNGKSPEDELMVKEIREIATDNVKRIILYKEANGLFTEFQSPYFIMNTQEIKTTWHPIEKIGG